MVSGSAAWSTWSVLLALGSSVATKTSTWLFQLVLTFRDRHGLENLTHFCSVACAIMYTTHRWFSTHIEAWSAHNRFRWFRQRLDNAMCFANFSLSAKKSWSDWKGWSCAGVLSLKWNSAQSFLIKGGKKDIMVDTSLLETISTWMSVTFNSGSCLCNKSVRRY